MATITVVHGGTIYSVNPKQPQIEAFAFENGEILATGQLAKIKKRYPGADFLDLNGYTAIPGLIDAHVHLLALGQALFRADLVGANSKQEALQRLEQFAKNLQPGEWLLGRGWDQNDWPDKSLPTAADLDALFADRPVWLTRIDGHAAWANSAAMRLADKNLDGDWQLDGGEIVRIDGKATGVFIDNAESLIASKVPEPDTKQLRRALAKAMNKTASVGLTSVHNAGTSKQVWDLLQAMQADNQLGIRYYAMADGANQMLDWLCANKPVIDPEAMLTARAVKLYSDGALGSRGAALIEPYSDRPKQRGLLIETPKVLADYAQRAANCGLQVNIHAIGDRGNRVTLNALEQASAVANNPGRHRIEHAQVIHADDFARLKKLELIASVQPTHATSDMYWAVDRVGKKRIRGAYAWQTFNNLGIPLALGSDFPVEKANPLLGFYAAVTRQDATGWPKNGWYSEQTLSRQQALYGFTLGAAYAAFQEDIIGSLEPGKKADFIVLSKDIMQIPATEILTTKVLQTYLNGRAIYQAN